MLNVKKLGMAVLAVCTIVGSIAATTTGAEARFRGGGGWHGGGFHGGRGFGIGLGVASGLALGAYGAGYYGYGPYPYGYGGGCIRNRVVGYTAYGRPIVRPVNVCY